MPGKVNPVMPEVMNSVCFKVIGNDGAVTIASQDGLLQLNAYEPVVADALFESQGLLFKCMPLFRSKCIEGITVNKDVLDHYMERSVGTCYSVESCIGI
jgi:aspartate ammonia-lyase